MSGSNVRACCCPPPQCGCPGVPPRGLSITFTDPPDGDFTFSSGNADNALQAFGGVSRAQFRDWEGFADWSQFAISACAFIVGIGGLFHGDGIGCTWMARVKDAITVRGDDAIYGDGAFGDSFTCQADLLVYVTISGSGDRTINIQAYLVTGIPAVFDDRQYVPKYVGWFRGSIAWDDSFDGITFTNDTDHVVSNVGVSGDQLVLITASNACVPPTTCLSLRCNSTGKYHVKLTPINGNPSPVLETDLFWDDWYGVPGGNLGVGEFQLYGDYFISDEIDGLDADEPVSLTLSCTRGRVPFLTIGGTAFDEETGEAIGSPYYIGDWYHARFDDGPPGLDCISGVGDQTNWVPVNLSSVGPVGPPGGAAAKYWQVEVTEI